MIPARKIIVMAKDFQEAAVAKLTEDLVRNGALIQDVSKKGVIRCEYAGRLDVLRKLPNVAGISPVITYNVPRTF